MEIINLKDGNVKAEDVRKVLVGGRYKEYVLKEELIAKMDNLLEKPPSSYKTY